MHVVYSGKKYIIASYGGIMQNTVNTITSPTLLFITEMLKTILEYSRTFSPLQILVLVRIIEAGEIKQTDLCKEFSIAQTTMSRVLARLGSGDPQIQGLYLIRTFRGIEADQRYLGACLSDNGLKLANKLRAICEKHRRLQKINP